MINRAVSWHHLQVNIPGVSSSNYNTETGFQTYCADWLRKQYEITGDKRFAHWHHSANERQGARAGLTAKLMGQARGFPDFIQCELKLALEFKVKHRQVTKEQLYWLEYFKSIGWTAKVIRNFNEFRKTVLEA